MTPHVNRDDDNDAEIKVQPFDTSNFGRRIGDAILAILVALIGWGGYYVQTLAADIRNMSAQIIVLQQKVERSDDAYKAFYDRLMPQMFSVQQGADLARRITAVEIMLDEHQELYAHHGAMKDLAVIQQRLDVINEKLKTTNK